MQEEQKKALEEEERRKKEAEAEAQRKQAEEVGPCSKLLALSLGCPGSFRLALEGQPELALSPSCFNTREKERTRATRVQGQQWSCSLAGHVLCRCFCEERSFWTRFGCRHVSFGCLQSQFPSMLCHVPWLCALCLTATFVIACLAPTAHAGQGSQTACRAGAAAGD